jgi:hypothetical protein
LDNPAYEIPRIVVAGRFSTEEEETRMHSALRDPVVLFLRLALILLLVTFAAQALSLSEKGDWYISTIVFPIVAACGWFLIAWALRVRRRRIEARANGYRDRWYDEKCIRAGCMFSFYRDHVACSTMRGSSILPYSAITRCCETMDGFVLESKHGNIVLRAADLTARETEQIRLLLSQLVNPGAYRVQATAYGRQSEPLPHVRFANFDTVITRAVGFVREPKWKRSELFGFIIPQLLVYSLTPGLMVGLTPWQLVDCLILAAVFVLVGCAFAWVTKRILTLSETEVRVAFTKDGVARQQNGFLTFMVNGRFRLREEPSGVVIYLSSGEEIFVPWDAVEQPLQLKEFLANRV